MSTNPDLQKVKACGEAIQEVLSQHPGGRVYNDALREIHIQVDLARDASRFDTYICEKAGSIKSFASILYSARKHQQYYQGGATTGAERVRHIIYADAQQLKNWHAGRMARDNE